MYLHRVLSWEPSQEEAWVGRLLYNDKGLHKLPPSVNGKQNGNLRSASIHDEIVDQETAKDGNRLRAEGLSFEIPKR